VAPASSGQQASWVRLAAAASVTWPVPEARAGCLLVEGDLEIAGQWQRAPQYFFLSASQPRVARSEKGCLVVTMALRD